MCCTKLHCLLALELNWVNRNDLFCASNARTLNCVGSDATNTHDNNGVARLYFGCIHARTPASYNTATEQTRTIEWHILFDLDATCFVHHSVLRKSS